MEALAAAKEAGHGMLERNWYYWCMTEIIKWLSAWCFPPWRMIDT
jgi:hypothetical protein